jgi:hypothetical protein
MSIAEGVIRSAVCVGGVLYYVGMGIAMVRLRRSGGKSSDFGVQAVIFSWIFAIPACIFVALIFAALAKVVLWTIDGFVQ